MAVTQHTLEAIGIRKSYGGIAALRGVDFRVRAGTVHGLLGENGAGKSTLIKILVGATTPDTGQIYLDGEEVRFTSVADAARHGVAVVSQELNLFPELDVLANLFPMREPTRGPFVSRARMAEQALPVLRELGLNVNLGAPAASLSLEQRQLLEIARALLVQPRVLVLDEPTSALHAGQTERLHAVLRTLRQRSVAVVYVSHILEDVLALCDVVTVLRDGERVVDAVSTAEVRLDELVQAMLGDKSLKVAAALAERSEAATRSAHALRFEHVTVPGRLRDVSFEAYSGEILGVAGLADSGHLDVLATAAGLMRPASGVAKLPDGSPIQLGQRRAIQQGIALIPGDRRRIGLMLDKPIWENVAQVRAVALGREGALMRSGTLREHAREYLHSLAIKASSPDQHVGQLSGGNQQKVVFAKWLNAQPTVLLLNDPTRGIDVGAKTEIYALIRTLAKQGVVQIFASTDPLELAAVCDRVLVFSGGRICAILQGAQLNAQTILEVMNTGKPPTPATSNGV